MLARALASAWAEIRPDDVVVPLVRSQVDLRDPTATLRTLETENPDAVIHTAAHVGGIADKAKRPLPYLLDNVRMDASVLSAVSTIEVERFLYIGSAAAYPADAVSPIAESELGMGRLEPANEGYGMAKLVGTTAVRYAARESGRAYRVLAPSNLYGPHDVIEPGRAHLIAAALVKTLRAHALREPTVQIWGDGTARREFTFAPDLAQWIAASFDDIVHWPELMNVGSGNEHTVRRYYEIAADVVGYAGELAFDPSKPSGVSRRLLDSSIARNHGWSDRTPIEEGMAICARSIAGRLERETTE